MARTNNEHAILKFNFVISIHTHRPVFKMQELCYPAEVRRTVFIVSGTLRLWTFCPNFLEKDHPPFSTPQLMCLECSTAFQVAAARKNACQILQNDSWFNSHEYGSGHPTKDQINSLHSQRIWSQIHMDPEVTLQTNLKGCLMAESKDKGSHNVATVTSTFMVVTISISTGSRGLWKVFLSLFLFL